MTPLASLGPYSLLSRYTEPGISAGFIARWLPITDSNRSLTVRFIDRSGPDPDRLDQEMTDALRLASRLNHINVAQVFDAGRLESRLYVVSEFIDGLGLSTIVDHCVDKGRGVPHDVAAFIVSELCAGLAYAHARRDERGMVLGLVHTDISPRNVSVSRAGQVKVLDFGLTWARRRAGLESADPEPRFAAPETFVGQWDVRSDIYSAGAIAWSLLAGRLPWAGLDGRALTEKIQTGQLEDLRTVDPSIPEELASAIMQALAPEPERRFRTATDLRTALSAWLRTGSPGFGAHRLKAWLQKELTAAFAASQLDASFTPLHRKDFVPSDTGSVLVEAAEIQPGFAERPALSALLTVTSPTPAPRPAKPGAKPAQAKPTALPASRPAPIKANPDVFATRDFTDEPEPLESSTAPTASATLSLSKQAPEAPAAAKSAPVSAPAPTDPYAGSSVILSAAAQAALAEDDDSEAEDVLNDVTRSVQKDDDVTLVASRQKSEGGWGPWVLLLLVIGACAGGWYAYVEYVLGGGVEEPEPTVAQVWVTSRPQGAQILVNGEPTGATTPGPTPEVAPGTTIEVSVRMDGYESAPAQSVEATGRPQADATFTLQPAPHTIRVDSEPAGATVMYQGQAVGITPYTLGPLRIDYRDGVDLTLRMDAYLDEPVAIDWQPGQAESSVRRSLQPNPNWVPPDADAGTDAARP